MNKTINNCFVPTFDDPPIKSNLNKISRPSELKTDHLTPGKVKKRRSLYVGSCIRQEKEKI